MLECLKNLYMRDFNKVLLLSNFNVEINDMKGLSQLSTFSFG
jgi:hypothetical protein